MRLSRRPRANPTGEMSILEHVGELRNRLAKSCAALVVTTVVAFSVLYDPVLEFVLRSYCALPGHRPHRQPGRGRWLPPAALSPLEPLSIRIRVSLTVGLLLAMPFIAFQLWRFITPGLRPSEKRYAIPFALASTLLFVAGVAVAFFTLPKAIDFLVSMGGEGIASSSRPTATCASCCSWAWPSGSPSSSRSCWCSCRWSGRCRRRPCCGPGGRRWP